MSVVSLSYLAGDPLKEYLISRGHRLDILSPDARFGRGVEAHADLRMCKIGISGPILSGSPPHYPTYPSNAAMCAVVLEKFLIHRLDITDINVLQYCRERKLREINVRQGYTRCSCAVVDGESLITSDAGIYSALRDIPGLHVLKISEGNVSLPGCPSGFIGGTSGIVDGELIFNGNLSAHPDFDAIRDFLSYRGVKFRFFSEYGLTDIGSIIEL